MPLRLLTVAPGPATPAGILARLDAGDRHGAVLLYERYGRSVNRLVAALLGPDAEHDDLVHEVLCALLANARRVRDHQHLDAWVRTVTTNLVRRCLRRRRFTRLFVSSEAFEAEPVSSSADPAMHDRLRRAWALIRALPTDERLAFVLRYCEQCSVNEVATSLGCSSATAKRRIERARVTVLEGGRRDVVLAEWLAGGLE